MRESLIDKMLGAVAPEAALRRARARMRLDALRQAQAHYDGATRGRRSAGWRRVSTDANAETRAANGILRDTARDLVRNNKYAAKAQLAIVTNVVGAGIIPQFSGVTQAATQRLEELAKAHLDHRTIDADGRLDLYGQQALAMATVFEAGECLLRRRRRRAEDGLPMPFQIQVLEPDFIDTSKDGPMPGGTTAVQGVEFDALGRRVAWWLFDQHPGAVAAYKLPVSRRVPAADVEHIYRVDRPGQVRGVTWLARVILPMHDFDDYQDAQRMRQKIAACFSIFEEDMSAEVGGGSPLVPQASGAGASEDQVELGPGAYIRLPAGRSIKFAQPPGVDGYGEYATIELRGIAAGLGVPYEALTGDLSNVNFSAGRLGWLDFQRSVTNWQNTIMIGQFGDAVARWFAEAAAVMGVGGKVSCLWTPPRREMIDPTKEVPALRDAVRAGQMSPSEVARQMGKDPADLFAEIAADFDRFDALGLMLDCDPRKISRAGVTNARPAGSEFVTSDGETGDA